jgi:hypothetical protein
MRIVRSSAIIVPLVSSSTGFGGRPKPPLGSLPRNPRKGKDLPNPSETGFSEDIEDDTKNYALEFIQLSTE